MSVLDWFFRTGSWVEEEIFHLLKDTPIFTDLRASDYRKLSELLHESHYGEGERIFTEGDPSSAIYLVRKGTVRLFREDSSGNRIDLQTVGEGDFFGEIALCEGIERSGSAEANSELHLMGIFRQELEEYIHKEPESGLVIYKNTVQMLGQRLYQSNDQLESLTSELESIREQFDELGVEDSSD